MNKHYLSFTLATLLLTACGGGNSSSSKNDGKGSVDFAQYFPKESMSKAYIVRIKTENTPSTTLRTEIVEVVGQNITTSHDSKVIEKVIVTDKNITITNSEEEDSSSTTSIYRHLDIGDTLFSKKIKFSEKNDLGEITTSYTHRCTVKSKVKTFEKGDYIYEGDLLKLECIDEGEKLYAIKPSILEAGLGNDLNGSHPTYDKSYLYLKKDLGKVAMLNDDCITNAKTLTIVNDKAKPSECVKTQYHYEFYVTQ